MKPFRDNIGQTGKISIITATMNSEKFLPGLIESLETQSDKKFDWIVADGGSTDKTLRLIEAVRNVNIIVSAEQDFGIYDALNRAITISENDYYLVVGSDDRLAPTAVADYKRAIAATGADIISARIIANGQVVGLRKIPVAVAGMAKYIPSHAVGAAFRKSLHLRYGYYSRHFPIAADKLFVLTSLRAGATIVDANFIAGEYNLLGFSGADVAGAITENFRVQLRIGSSKWIQIPLLISRLLRHLHRL